MSDKPLRHEDTLALQEANRKLTEENEKLKVKKDKRPRPNPIPPRIISAVKNNIGTTLFFGFIACLIGLFACAIWYGDDRDRARLMNGGCFYIDKIEGQSQPWQPFHIWRRVKRHYVHDFIVEDKTFNTLQDAQDFMKQWNLQECK